MSAPDGPSATELAATRADLHAFFAQLWSPPDPRENGGLEELVTRWTAVSELLDTKASRGALAFLQGITDDGDAFAKEHHALLCARITSYVAPFESVNRDVMKDDEGGWSTGTLRGPQWHRVKVDYRRLGFVPPEDPNFDLDHIAVELRFLSALALAEAAAFAEGDVARAAELREHARAFISEHPMTWLSTLAERIAQLSATSYFGDMARATLDWLKLEHDALSAG